MFILNTLSKCKQHTIYDYRGPDRQLHNDVVSGQYITIYYSRHINTKPQAVKLI